MPTESEVVKVKIDQTIEVSIRSLAEALAGSTSDEQAEFLRQFTAELFGKCGFNEHQLRLQASYIRQRLSEGAIIFLKMLVEGE